MLGRQGAGKGTQCVRVARHFDVPHISTGDMLRAAVRAGSEVGLRAKGFMDRGELLPDEVIIEVVDEQLTGSESTRGGFVLDGFPRTVAQAEALDKIVAPLGGLDVVIDLDVPVSVVLERLASRRVCEKCGANYSVAEPPTNPWVCDACGGDVVQRDDDTPVAIRRRLDLYEQETAPLVAWYAERDLLETVDGLGDADDVSERIIAVIDARRSKR
ncbi:MAG: adenylate kinase [Actinobacteria bacterium]|nr:adenylate kinase [Actinomycetota bacterium]